MLRSLTCLIIAFLYPVFLSAQDTFSIVAIDSVTQEIGSAGASCLDDRAIAGGVRVISDVIPGRGAIHTQSFYVATNQANARTRLLMGSNASQIMSWLVNNDIQLNPGVRQYGAVTIDTAGNIDAAAFTGANCLDVKAQRVGPNYAIQGNILIGEAVLDSMEARFLRTEGELSVKLMAAMQGANIPGADSRCLSEGVSSLSAFLRVAKPDDLAGAFYLDLSVPRTAFGVEPIDSLQVLFDMWKVGNTSVSNRTPYVDQFQIHYDSQGWISVQQADVLGPETQFYLYNIQGKKIEEGKIGNGQLHLSQALPNGTYLITLSSRSQLVSRRFSVLN